MTDRDAIYVTGANGFIGTWLVKSLLEQGHRVRALARNGRIDLPPGVEDNSAVLQSEALEIVGGDVTDRDSILSGMQGCTRVFHLAALAKNWARDRKVFHHVNVEGTRNVLEAAYVLGVERVVCTSTFVTFGPSRHGAVHTEETPRISQRYFNDYEATKVEAERVMLQFAEQGLPVVIVNPARVFGPGHINESNALVMLMDDYLSGRMPILVNRGIDVGNYVLVHDVVDGHILAMEKGRVGQRYILGGENVSLRKLAILADEVSGRRHLKIPTWKVAPMCFAYFHALRARLFGVYPKITPGWMRMFMTDWAYDCEKARRELGYRPTPLREALKATYEWLMRVKAKPETSAKPVGVN